MSSRWIAVWLLGSGALVGCTGDVKPTDTGTTPTTGALDNDGDGLTNAEELGLGTDPDDEDTDDDALDDGFEVNDSLTDPLVADTDEDGLLDGEEVNTTNTDPLVADTDEDGLLDGEEVNTYLTDPLVVDTDGDTLSDGDEVNVHMTDPTLADTDGDTLSDGDEIDTHMSDPTLADTDKDGLDDGEEVNTYLTDPTMSDSDGDGLADGDEVNVYYTVPTRADSDGDTLSDGDEVNLHSTDPNNVDTDGDTLDDAEEINNLGTSPILADTDADGLDDNVEIATTGTDPEVPDTDGDGLTDGEEVNTYGTLPLEDDSDSDGLLDGEEVNTYGTLPLDNDTDDDGLTDGVEVNTYGTQPLVADSDSDGLSDGEEVNTYGTQPLNADTDGEGLGDGAEITFGSDPTLADTDSDGLDDQGEFDAGADPRDTDSDDDGLLDGEEVNTFGTLPTNPDTDGDTLSDFAEVNDTNTDPTLADTDSDGLDDAREVNETLTDPTLADTDSDGLQDGEEVDTYGTNPLEIDTDADGLTDGAEVTVHLTDPLVGDTDADGLLDGDEVNVHLTDPLDPDPDGDGVLDGREIDEGIDPFDPDTDGDGLLDGEELDTFGTDPLLVDTDGDTLSDFDEINTSLTDPLLADSDADGLDDDVEINNTLTDPNLADTDGDGLLDGVEVNVTNTDPTDADPDGDGVLDGREIDEGIDPFDPDTDGDGLTDGEELDTYGSDPTLTDSDADGLSDGDEVNVHGSDPTLTDTDTDGIGDGSEVIQYGTNPALADSDAGGTDDLAELQQGTDPNTAGDDVIVLPSPIYTDDFEGGAFDPALWAFQDPGVVYDDIDNVGFGTYSLRIPGGDAAQTAPIDTTVCTDGGLLVTTQISYGIPNMTEDPDGLRFSYFDGNGLVTYLDRIGPAGTGPWELEAQVIADPDAIRTDFALHFFNFGTNGDFDHQSLDNLAVTCVDGGDADGDGVANFADCDDTDPLHFSDCGLCVDLDLDGRGTDCDAGPDCDPADDTIYAGAPDPIGDGIDQDCSTFDGPGLYDGFETGAPDDYVWAATGGDITSSTTASVGTEALLLGGGSNRDGAFLETRSYDMSSCDSVLFELDVDEDSTDLDDRDTFQLQAWDRGVWVTLRRVFADELTGYTTLSGNIPFDPADTRFRIFNNSDSTADDMLIDEFVLSCGNTDADGDGYDSDNDCDDSDGFLWASCTTCVDSDGDGFGAGCDLGPDCDDNDATIFPGAADTYGDSTDTNCSGADGAGIFSDFEAGVFSPFALAQIDGNVFDETTTVFSGTTAAAIDGYALVVTQPIDTTSCPAVTIRAEAGNDTAESSDELLFEYWDGSTWQLAGGITGDDAPWTSLFFPINDPNALASDFRARIVNTGSTSSSSGDVFLVDDFFVGCAGLDSDGDGFPVSIDCDDNDPLLWFSCATCVDSDGDGRGTECDLGIDCDDTDATIYYGNTDTAGDGIDSDCSGADGAGLFNDFESGTLQSSLWTVTNGTASVDTSQGANGSTASLNLSGTDIVETLTIDMSYCTTGILWAYEGKRGPEEPDSGDDIELSYWDGTQLVLADTWLGGGVDPDFSPRFGVINDPNAANTGFYIQLENTSISNGSDNFFLDDFTIACASADGDGDGFPPEIDCDDTDANLWFSCATCVDMDGDGRGTDCDLSLDCDDNDPNNYYGNTDTAGDGIDTDCSGFDGAGFDYDFESGTLDSALWTVVNSTPEATTSQAAKGSVYSLDISGTEIIATTEFDMSYCTTDIVWFYDGKRGPELPDAGDDIEMSYWDGTQLVLVDTWLGGAVDPDFSGRSGVISDPNALNADFYLQFENTSVSNGSDNFYIDNLRVACSSTDGDGDGFPPEIDCDDTDPNLWFSCATCVDGDGDGYGMDCDLGEDCDDGDSASFPGAADSLGDGVDQSCDGIDGTPLLYDDFENNGPDTAVWSTVQGNVIAASDPLLVNSGGFAVEIDGGTVGTTQGLLESVTVDASGCNEVVYSFYVKQGDQTGSAPEIGDDLEVSFDDGTGYTLADSIAGLDAVVPYQRFIGVLPAAAVSSTLSFEIVNTSTSTSDEFHIDDFVVGCSNGDGDGDGFPDLVDCDDTDANLWNSCADCIDGDGDGFGDFCDLGPDCDDTDNTVFPGAADSPGDSIDQDCSGFDGPGYVDGFELGGPDPVTWDLTSITGPVYYSTETAATGAFSLEIEGTGSIETNTMDTTNCDNIVYSIQIEDDGLESADVLDLEYWDGTSWNIVATGVDGDSYTRYFGEIADALAYATGFQMRLIHSSTTTPGDAARVDNFLVSCGSDVDNDGDGFVPPLDCDDTNATLWFSCATCVDMDGDGYGPTCDLGEDCDDTDNTIFPGAADSAGDGIDQDCSGLDGVGISDDFESGVLRSFLYSTVAGDPVVQTAYVAGGTFALEVDGTEILETVPRDFSGCANGIAWSWDGKRGPDTPETNDDLEMYYWDGTQLLLEDDWLGGATDTAFALRSGTITDPNAANSGFYLRWEHTGTLTDFDDFFIDNLTIDCAP